MIENSRVDFKNVGINVGTNDGRNKGNNGDNDGRKVLKKNDFWVVKK